MFNKFQYDEETRKNWITFRGHRVCKIKCPRCENQLSTLVDALGNYLIHCRKCGCMPH